MRVATAIVCLLGVAACGSSKSEPPPAPPAPAPPVTDWARPVPTGTIAEPGYAGAAACTPCHEAIAKSYAKHGMARTGVRPLAALDRAWLAKIFEGAAPVKHELTGFSYRPYRDGERFFVEETREGGHAWAHEVTHAMGSGEAGMAFYRKDGDRFFQIPIDWYPSSGRWGIDPGFTNNDLRFGTTLDAVCVACHTDPPRRSAGAASVFVEPMPPGVGCERCHGPGAAHVASSKSEDIASARRMTPRQQIDVCAQCHQDTGSVYLPGTQPFGFRPGDSLAVFRRNHVREPAEPDRVVLLAHPERMMASACFTKSEGKLVCTTCHDPHVSSRGRPVAHWREKCNGCHADPKHACTEDKQVRAKAGDDCVRCHMRTGATDDIALVDVVDHWIQVRPPPIATTPPAPAKQVVAWAASGPAPEADAALAMGFDVHGLPNEAEARAQAAIAAGSRVPEVYELVAAHQGARRAFDAAARTLAKVLVFAPNRRRALMAFALAALDAGTPAWAVEADRALDRMIALDPRDQRALEVKGMLALRDKRYGEGKALLLRATAAGPGGGSARVGLAALALHEADRAAAIEQLKAAQQIEPRDPWIRQRLAELGIGTPLAAPLPPPMPVSAWLPPELR